MQNLSASQLIKSSMAQCVYLYKKSMERPVTEAQKRGNEHAEQISKGLSQELRGTYYDDNDLFRLYFVIDALDDNIAFEIKNVEGEYEDWYFKSSLIQSSFYFSLLDKVNYLDTPKFRKKEGYEEQFIDLNDHIIDTFVLQFGEDSYYIEQSQEIFDHYLTKAVKFIDYIDLDWEEAMYESKKWDSKYKFKEVDMFDVTHQKLDTPLLQI